MDQGRGRPAYEVVGPLERVDERDTLFARERLEPGSPEERAYYEGRPQLAELDRRLKAFLEGHQEREGGKWRPAAFYQGTFGPIPGLALPDMVDGPVSERRLELGPGEATALVKAFALRLGADRAAAGPLDQAWVYARKGCPPFFRDYRSNPPFFPGSPPDHRDLEWGDPIELGHAHALSLAFRQDLGLTRSSPAAASDLEVGRVYARAALVAVQVAFFIRSLGYGARAHHLRSSSVLMVPVAADAGLGEPARCGYLLAKGLGLGFRLACVTTELPLEHDPMPRLRAAEFCARCQKCAKACPAGAIPSGGMEVVRGVRKWRMDAERCLLYWGATGSACALCQAVCPWSKPETPFHRVVAALAAAVPSLARLLVRADDWMYGRKPRPPRLPGWLGG